MTRTVWDPFAEMEALRREVEQAFEGFGRRPAFRSAFLPGTAARAYPRLNVHEDADHIYVVALAPGLNPDTLEIAVHDNQLRIAGEKSPLSGDIKPEAIHRGERGAGRFVRTLPLPANIDSDKIAAEYGDGLLRITMPKPEEAKPKRIDVRLN